MRSSRVDLQAVFICGALLIAVCFMMLPALMLPGWEAPRIGHLMREKFSTKHLSAKHLRRLKALFTKRKRDNSSLEVPAILDAVNETEDGDDSPYLNELEARRSSTQLIDMLRVLGDSADGQARLFGFIATPPPPPRRFAVVEDEELAGPVPEGMFTLRHVSHSICKDMGMENRTLATTLSGCATRCLLVNRESGSRTCSHFGWIPRLRECFIYSSCTRRELFGEKVKLYEKNVVHLREEGEGLCMEHVSALSFVDHRTCDFTSSAQQWLYDPALAVLKLASDLNQCLDFFPEQQDFGVWACHDSANHEFMYDHVGKLCAKKASSNGCVQNATAENFYLQLRLPGEASCFHFGGQFDGKTHMIIHRTCEERTEQWWQFERETLSFKHSTDSSICLNWNTGSQGFDIWKCYNTPKQQFQFSKYRLTYCLRHDLRQCLQAVENLAGSGLQLRLPGDTSCLQYAPSYPLSHDMCRVTNTQQHWLFESSTMRFRHSVLNQNCLQFDEATTDFTALECSTDPGQKFHASLGTDGRKYCIGKNEHKCVQEATLGPELQLHLPMAIDCLQFDGKMQVLQQAECDEANGEQKWVLDIATYMFHYASDVTLCLDYMEDEESFSAEPCHDSTPGQRFEQKNLGRYCMSNRQDVCVTEAALMFKY